MSAMRVSPSTSPRRSQSGSRRPRRTKAQIAADLALSGHVVGSKPSAAAVKRSRIAAKKRADSAASASNTKRSNMDSPAFELIDYKTIVAYLAKPNVLNSLFGGGSQTKVTGLPMSPKTLLNTLAIKLNNNYNERHNTTDMHLTGRTLLLRLRRYKSKYQSAKSLSSKTGAGLEPKHHARGIHTMEALLESMCPCYPEMDALFRDKGNVNPFGILDSGLGPQDINDSQDEFKSDSDTTDGHDHGTITEVLRRFPSPEPEDVADFEEIFNTRPLSPSPVSPLNTPGSPDPLNVHYRRFLKNEFSLPPPTPKGRDELSPIMQPRQLPDVTHNVQSASDAKKSKSRSKTVKHTTNGRGSKSALTAEERALDSSSDDDATTAPATQATAVRGARATLARRGLDPLPSIDPSHVHSKDHKHALATAIQQANEAKMEVIAKAQDWRQQFDQARMKSDEARIQAESEDRKSNLTWTKERYFLDREEQRDSELRRLAQDTRKERKAFCERLVFEGKTAQEVEAFLRLIYPDEDVVAGK